MAISRRFSGWLAGPLVLSAGLRFFQLSRSSYWLDEMTSLHLASQPHFRALFSDNNPPLYHLVLKFWIALFGTGEWATRSMSVLFSVIATAFVMMAVYEIRKSHKTVALAGVLHALCLLSIAFAREARMYALFEMWMAISLYLFMSFYRRERGGSNRRLLAYVGVCTAMALTHYLAVVPIFIEFVFLALSAKKLSGTKRALLGLVFLLLLAAQAWIYSHFFRWDGLQWQLLKSSAESTSFWPSELLMKLGDGSWVAAVPLAIIFVVSVYQLIFSPENERTQRVALVSLILAPILGFSVGTLIAQRAMLLPRYFVFLAPPFCALIALAKINWRKMAPIAAGLILVGALSGLRQLYLFRHEPWRDVAGIIQKFPGSVVYTTRTLALRTPYFDRIGVPVKQLNPGSPNGLAELSADAAQGRKVWILENFWGGYTYLPELKQTLSSLHLATSELSVRDQGSAPVLVIEVEKQEPKDSKKRDREHAG